MMCTPSYDVSVYEALPCVFAMVSRLQAAANRCHESQTAMRVCFARLPPQSEQGASLKLET